MKEKENKICPIMSRPIITYADYSAADLYEVICRKEDCMLWSLVYTTDKILISGCSFEIAAHKNQDGQYAV